MAGQSTYVASSRLGRWLDLRLPLPRLIHDQFQVYPTPRNLNVWYTFGGILAFLLGAQIVTGVVLAMRYTPNSELAFESVERIMRDVSSGWLIRYLHANGASFFFIAVYIHILRGLYYGSYKEPRELLWIVGVVIYLLMTATAFIGYVLPWGQMSYWGATVILNLFGAIPLIGDDLVVWLQGDFSVGNATLNRFFSLHYLLPFVIASVAVVHVWALHVAGNNNPTGVDVKGPRDTVPLHPYYTSKDFLFLILFLTVFAYFVFYLPNFFGNPDNYQLADPLKTPPHIVPEWYFLTYYAMLRSIPHELLGMAVMASAMLTLFFVPWLDRSPVRSNRYRPLMKPFFWTFVAACVALAYCGSQPADAGFAGIPLVWIARLSTVYYFAFFWIVMPIVGVIEKPQELPAAIAESAMPSLDEISGQHASSPEGSPKHG